MPPSEPMPRLLITAGPTREPLDSVRFLSNRSSGRMGLALAAAGRALGWPTTLLLGPITTHHDPDAEPVRFETTADLSALLHEHWPGHDLLIMAAAVCDHRPARRHDGKLRREGATSLDLEPTEDVVASLDAITRPGQVRVGFALEPRDRMEQAARAKLERKHLDAIVANPLETMDSETVDAMLIDASGTTDAPAGERKEIFARWLLDEIASRYSPGMVDTMPVQGLDADA